MIIAALAYCIGLSRLRCSLLKYNAIHWSIVGLTFRYNRYKVTVVC